ncbi:hypothetical protein FHG64_06385 [Antarcticibacterium flavum]|uniref:Lipoprotein n=1 Tax=Antarcticibacterium flavum TaxID=2058175 RepID=A0A5B7X346_9FLAO|nr:MULTISPECIES: hypothetical protein [Antarcticibacterium]MCM4161276.1 hypothetical protein [Antarcticibacterium sp. W02-3]QCY69063.1 hypothetical protein FHG64_06385 [Antarcticibacterium flavum]
MKKLYFLPLFIFLFYSCSNPLQKEYNEETLAEDAKELKESGNLNEKEAELLAGWIVKSKLSGEDLEGKTYKEILDEARDYKKEQEELAERTRREEEEKRQLLGSVLTVAMYNKGYDKRRYQEYLTYSLAFENTSDKDIRAFKGSLVINDLFDTEIKSINLTVDDPIIAGETYRGTYTTDYNQFMDEDSRLRSKKMEDLKVVWTPEKIIFTDGSTLE